MSIPYEKIVADDLNLGYDPSVVVTMPAGGTALGAKIGIHTFLPQVYNVKDFGAVGDNVHDDRDAIQAAHDALPSAGGHLIFPPGTYRLRSGVTFSKPGLYTGSGYGTAILRIDSVTADGVTLSGAPITLADLSVTSTTAARSGNGIVVTSGPETIVRRVKVSGHFIGVSNKYGGNEFSHVIVSSCLSHGFFCDGNAGGGAAQNEIGIYFCQSNGNAGDGFRLRGSGLGVWMVRATAASNTGYGIHTLPGAAGSLDDVFIDSPEISANAGGIYIESGCSKYHLSNIFIETSVTTANITVASPLVTIVGGISQAAVDVTNGYGLVLNHTDIAVSGLVVTANAGGGIVHGASAGRVSLAGVVASNVAGAQAFGIRFDGGTAVSIVGGNYIANTLVTSGVIPATSRISAAIGIADQ